MKWLCNKICVCMLAVPILFLVAEQSPAAGIGFRNSLKVPIIIQGKSIVNNMLRNGLPIVIYPGKYAWDNNLPPGPRYITIFDRNQPRKVLFQTPPTHPLPFQGKDIFFDIQFGRNPLGQPGIFLIQLKQFPRMPR